MAKRQTFGALLIRLVQSAFTAGEITVLADLLTAACGASLPRAVFWTIFFGGTVLLFVPAKFTRRARRIAALSVAGAAVLAVLVLFLVWHAFAANAAYAVAETDTEFFENRRVLAVVPHEDDEVNLLGGVIESFTDAGSEVYVVFTSTGDAGGQGEERVHEAVAALGVLGVPEDHIIFLGYGDGYPWDSVHIYNAEPGVTVPSLSGRTETHAAPEHPAYREGAAYTRENYLADLRSVLEDIRADMIFCVDYDANVDHRAASLFFDEALGQLLAGDASYKPLVFKGFAYSTAYRAAEDFYDDINLLSTVRSGGERSEENGISLWSERVRLPVSAAGLSHSLTRCRTFTAAREYATQNLWHDMAGILNGDKVFWQRNTGSVLYGASVSVSSGDGAELTDFRLLHSPDIRTDAMPYEAVWIPAADDADRTAEFTFAAADITEIRLYDNPSPDDNVLAAEIVFPSGNTYEVRDIDPAGTSVYVNEPDCTGFTVRLTETEGAAAGLTEAEAYALGHDTLPALVKLTDADGNFVYDCRLSPSETETELSLYALSASGDWEDYTVRCEGEGCTAEVQNGALRVTCPRGKRCTVTVTNGTISDTVTVSHTGLLLRTGFAIEKYAAQGLPKTNLYAIAAQMYRKYILKW